MHCKNCGKEVNERAAVCPNCGVPTDEKAFSQNTVKENDAPSAGFAVLGFLIPLVGLILYLVWKGTYPLKAKSCGKGALIGVIVEFVLGFVMGIIMALAGAALYAAAPIFLL